VSEYEMNGQNSNKIQDSIFDAEAGAKAALGKRRRNGVGKRYAHENFHLAVSDYRSALAPDLAKNKTVIPVIAHGASVKGRRISMEGSRKHKGML
jgi:hypothetical protein